MSAFVLYHLAWRQHFVLLTEIRAAKLLVEKYKNDFHCPMGSLNRIKTLSRCVVFSLNSQDECDDCHMCFLGLCSFSVRCQTVSSYLQ